MNQKGTGERLPVAWLGIRRPTLVVASKWNITDSCPSRSLDIVESGHARVQEEFCKHHSRVDAKSTSCQKIGIVK